jgi:hypothetical protein
VKDLYKRTGINPTSSAEVIGRLLASEPDSEDRAAARQILLVEHRRRVYDRVRETYVTLGAVGANLRLSTAIPEDFRPPPTAFGAQIPRYLRRYRWKLRQRNRGGLLAALFIFVFIGIVAVLSRLDKSRDYVPTTSNSSPARTVPTSPSLLTRPAPLTLIPTPTPFDQPAKPLPNSGAFWTFTSQARIAPLKITTQSGSRYYIKLIDARNKARVIAIFVDGAQTIQVDVPLGTFELRYASGMVWYGQKYLFGPKTQCIRGMDFLTFSQDGNYVNGHEVTLYKVPYGNFETTEIDASEF